MPHPLPSPRLLRRPAGVAAALVLAVGVAGCARGDGGPVGAVRQFLAGDVAHAGAAESPAACRRLDAATLGAIARRVYAQAATGRNVRSAVRRLGRSAELAAAVAHGDAGATRQALAPLLKHQIRRITITRGVHVLARYGRAPALAPVRGVLRGRGGAPVGRYVLSVSEDAAITGVVHALTRARVTIAPGPVRASASATRGGFGVRAFPRGARHLSLRFAPGSLDTCAGAPAQTVADTVGAVGRRLLATETGGAAVRRVLRHVATDARFRHAVATDDAGALRTAIVRFFRTRSLHVVRIRAVTASGRLVNDVGGPDVLAPASRVVRARNGRVLGRVTLSVQDDTGYIKLVHRFTGADVLLRRPGGQVAGSSLQPGPTTIPARGAITYRGVALEAYSFAARGFPTGPLRISLLLPPRQPATSTTDSAPATTRVSSTSRS